MVLIYKRDSFLNICRLMVWIYFRIVGVLPIIAQTAIGQHCCLEFSFAPSKYGCGATIEESASQNYIHFR